MEYVVYWGKSCEDGEPVFETKNGAAHNNPKHDSVKKFRSADEAKDYLIDQYGNDGIAEIITIGEGILIALAA